MINENKFNRIGKLVMIAILLSSIIILFLCVNDVQASEFELENQERSKTFTYEWNNGINYYSATLKITYPNDVLDIYPMWIYDNYSFFPSFVYECVDDYFIPVRLVPQNVDVGYQTVKGITSKVEIISLNEIEYSEDGDFSVYNYKKYTSLLFPHVTTHSDNDFNCLTPYILQSGRTGRTTYLYRDSNNNVVDFQNEVNPYLWLKNQYKSLNNPDKPKAPNLINATHLNKDFFVANFSYEGADPSQIVPYKYMWFHDFKADEWIKYEIESNDYTTYINDGTASITYNIYSILYNKMHILDRADDYIYGVAYAYPGATLSLSSMKWSDIAFYRYNSGFSSGTDSTIDDIEIEIDDLGELIGQEKPEDGDSVIVDTDNSEIENKPSIEYDVNLDLTSAMQTFAEWIKNANVFAGFLGSIFTNLFGNTVGALVIMAIGTIILLRILGR